MGALGAGRPDGHEQRGTGERRSGEARGHPLPSPSVNIFLWGEAAVDTDDYPKCEACCESPEKKEEVQVLNTDHEKCWFGPETHYRESYSNSTCLASTGAGGCALSLLWFVLFYDDPEEHPCISLREKEFIRSSVVQVKRRCPMPWGLGHRAQVPAHADV